MIKLQQKTIHWGFVLGVAQDSSNATLKKHLFRVCACVHVRACVSMWVRVCACTCMRACVWPQSILSHDAYTCKSITLLQTFRTCLASSLPSVSVDHGRSRTLVRVWNHWLWPLPELEGREGECTGTGNTHFFLKRSNCCFRKLTLWLCVFLRIISRSEEVCLFKAPRFHH